MSKNLEPPKTSYEWYILLDNIKKGENDFSILEVMQKGSIDWIDGVAPLFVKDLLETIDLRLHKSTDNFQRMMQNKGLNEATLIANIRKLKRDIEFLYKLAGLQCLPDEQKKQYRNLVQINADKIQENLENSARNDRTGKIAYLVRNNKINVLGD